MIHYGIIGLLVKAFRDRTEKDLIQWTLQAIDQVLQYGNESEKNNPYVQELVELEGFEAIQKLKDYPDDDVKESAEKIIEKYGAKEL